jgi:DNA-binding transcriptional MerR regulator
VAEIPDKAFYKIGEVCQYTDTQPYVLRFWESEFPRLAPEKSRSGQRMYTRRDIDLVLRIKQLLYEEEFTIAGARKKLEQEETAMAGGAPVPATQGTASPPEAVPAPQAAKPAPVTLFPGGEPPLEPARTSGNAPPPPTPTPGERARAAVAETEIGALRKRIAELEARQAAAVTALERSEAARRGERERRERVAARLEALLRSLDRPRADDGSDVERA